MCIFIKCRIQIVPSHEWWVAFITPCMIKTRIQVIHGLIMSSTKKDDLIFSGRSFLKMRNRTGPKTDFWGTPDRTRTGSEA